MRMEIAQRQRTLSRIISPATLRQFTAVSPVRLAGCTSRWTRFGTLTVSAIPAELRQVLCNLVANSLDATPKGGRICLRSHLSNCKGVPSIRETVADTGSGIQPEHLHHIFEPFFTTKDNFGTGLGLWVTSELIRRNQGEIRVRSRVGRGTVFTLVLPEAVPESHAFDEAMTESLITSGPTTDLVNAASSPLPIDVAQQGESAIALPLIKSVSTETMDAWSFQLSSQPSSNFKARDSRSLRNRAYLHPGH